MRLKISAFLLFLLLVKTTFASGNLTPLTVLVKDEGRQVLIGATVQLSRLDTGQQWFATTNLSGMARFDGLDNAHYLLQIRYVGYTTIERPIILNPDQRHFEFVMAADAIALGEVTITARRPLVRQEDDKMIVDPEPLVGLSTNTLEILEKTPGLFVDQDGGIFLSSATPAAIYINGREQKMSSQDINTILRSLPPASVLRIEVIRTPSTRYDAASSGGIINIVLKKGVKIGRFGSVNTGMNQGAYGNRFLGFSLNNSGDKTTSYLNVNYNYNARLDELNSLRYLSTDSILSQGSENVNKNNQAYVGYGLGYEFSPSMNLAYDGRINGSTGKSDAFTLNFLQAGDERLSENHNNTLNRSGFLSLQQDMAFNWKLDTLGSEWDSKVGFSYNLNAADQEYVIRYAMPFAGLISGEGDNEQGRYFFLAQTDLTYQLPLKIKMETGLKSTWQEYASQSDYFVFIQEDKVVDPRRTNAFDYSERINSWYAQASFNLPGQLVLKGGVRMEHTFMEGRQTIPADTSFVINRADWFPYLYLSRHLVNIAGFDLRAYAIYRRTIGRPGYASLNPYVRYVDQYLYETGNPALKPQFTHNYEANISLNEMPIFALGRNDTRDIFSQVVYQDKEQSEVMVRTYDNVGRSREHYFRAMAGIPPGGRYFFAIGGQYNHNRYDGMYESEPLSFTRGSWRLFTFHSLNLARNTRLSMMGFMMINGQMNFYELRDFGQLNFGLNQTFLDKKLTVSLHARDVLGTMLTKFDLQQGSLRVTGDRYTDTRRFGFNVRYNFGIRNKKEERPGMMPFNMEEP